MAQIPPFYLDAVVAIGVRTNGVVRWTASGFFYGRFIAKVTDDNE